MTASNPTRNTHILLVEDDELDIENVRRAFKEAGITNPLWVATSGPQALEMLRSSAIPAHRRLVLLDLNMLPKNGLETLREIRQDPSLDSLSVVMLTTSSEPRDRDEAYRLNVAGYLVKPLKSERLVEMMTALSRYWNAVEFP